MPADGDTAVVALATARITLTNATAVLGAFEMSAGRLEFQNWSTCLNATNILIQGGTVGVVCAFAEGEMSNRVWLACSNNFTLLLPGRIDVTGRGYTNCNGPGTPFISDIAGYSGGGGHGGPGGIGYYLGGAENDSLTEPVFPGSGGNGTNIGGSGGGVVRIEAGGAAYIGGQVVANGSNAIASLGGGGVRRHDLYPLFNVWWKH